MMLLMLKVRMVIVYRLELNAVDPEFVYIYSFFFRAAGGQPGCSPVIAGGRPRPAGKQVRKWKSRRIYAWYVYRIFNKAMILAKKSMAVNRVSGSNKRKNYYLKERSYAHVRLVIRD